MCTLRGTRAQRCACRSPRSALCFRPSLAPRQHNRSICACTRSRRLKCFAVAGAGKAEIVRRILVDKDTSLPAAQVEARCPRLLCAAHRHCARENRVERWGALALHSLASREPASPAPSRSVS